MCKIICHSDNVLVTFMCRSIYCFFSQMFGNIFLLIIMCKIIRHFDNVLVALMYRFIYCFFSRIFEFGVPLLFSLKNTFPVCVLYYYIEIHLDVGSDFKCHVKSSTNVALLTTSSSSFSFLRVAFLAKVSQIFRGHAVNFKKKLRKILQRIQHITPKSARLGFVVVKKRFRSSALTW